MEYKLNNEFKSEFLKVINEQFEKETVKKYIAIFNKAADMEEYFEKDLYEFTSYEVSQFLYSYKSSDMYSLSSTASLIYKYQLIAYNKNLTTIIPKRFGVNELGEYLDVCKMQSKYLTYNDYRKILSRILNAQDKAIFILLWHGVLGKEGADLINLQTQDVDFETKTINFIDVNGKNKIIELEDFETYIIKKAIEQETYITLEIESNSKERLTEEEIDEKLEKRSTINERTIKVTPYLLRKIKIGGTKDEEEKLKYQGLRNRWNVIKKSIMLQQVTFKSLYDSGIVYRVLRDDIKYESATELKEYIEQNNLNINYFNLQKVIKIIIDKIEKENNSES